MTHLEDLDFIKKTSLIDILHWRAQYYPEHKAYTFLPEGNKPSITMTFQDIDRCAYAVAVLLRQRGVAEGARALLLYHQGLDYIIAFLGCLYAGVIAVPMYPPRPKRGAARVLGIAEDAGATHILTTSSIVVGLRQAMAEHAPLQTMPLSTTDDLPVTVDETHYLPSITGETIAFLQYTSGSTSTPKGVMVSHANLLANEQMIQQAFENSQDTTFVSWLPLYHDMGLIGNVLQALYVGAHCVLLSPLVFMQRPIKWLQAISQYRARFSGAPNFAYDLCVSRVTPEQRATLDLSSWRVAFNGAEPVRHDTLQKFSAAFQECGFQPQQFFPCYGLAEASVFVSGGSVANPPVTLDVQMNAFKQHQIVTDVPDGAVTCTLVGCGQPQLDGCIKIVNPETRIPCQDDQVGEVWVAGSHVAKGYWNRPEETKYTFAALLADNDTGPFLRTGDLGFLHNGELYLTGRRKDLIIVEGTNHYPQDIELTVEQHHSEIRTGCCAAFAVDIEGKERVVIVAEVERQYQPLSAQPPNTDTQTTTRIYIDKTALLQSIRRSIAEQHNLPVHEVVFIRLGSIPKTSSGKIQRRACREQFLRGTLNLWEK
ncbi:MAG: type I polyketide synthase [Chloroflexi bacterium AL-W]|nr:type I polyketide synthase [Chloroflexi bacterium AL-N1]NOK71318.1 type I polyketide synthase [Chloroflexi bacterium AL-N10]NOK78664.1 type I polyketide synthase [Chloroflexi bacterium AL-N5]NOK85960.1 type I polyketide synthase [Chloroflexi bacterium AL-W]NOK93043.1 type I polyketide synthase [Chloroflexi bacterium AL-N15]